MAKKAQIAIEYLLLIGLLLLVLIPLMFYANREASVSIRSNSAEDVVKTLALAADEVYSLGPGSRKIVDVNIPSGVQGNIQVGGEQNEEKKQIKLVLKIYGTNSDVFSITKSEVQGGVSGNEGLKRVEVIALEDYVLIGEDKYPPVVISTLPTGIINYDNPLLVAITDEAAECKFVQGNENFDYANGVLMQGTGTSHTMQLSGLTEGNYIYSVKCKDYANPANMMTGQALIQFTISFSSADNIEPEVSLVFPENDYYKNNSHSIKLVYKTCDPTFDNCEADSSISSCKITITQTESGAVIENTDNSVIENENQEFVISLANGEYFWKVSCTDTSLNANVGESETRKFTIDVPEGMEDILGALADKGIDKGYYYKTNGDGLNTLDSAMAAKSDITLDLLDDNSNTPPVTAVIRYRSGEKYEGFWVELNEDTAQYDKIVLYGRVRVIDVDPFTLIIHGYNSDFNTPNLNTIIERQVNDITNEKVKWVELDITDIARLEDGYGKMKFRVTAKNLVSQNSKKFQFSELHIKVGNYA